MIFLIMIALIVLGGQVLLMALPASALTSYAGPNCTYTYDNITYTSWCLHGTCSSDSTCNCSTGWSGQNCSSDINECAVNNGGCSNTCVNSAGGYSCSCPTGYQLQGLFTCVDIDECGTNNGGCAQNCTNKAGSFVCSCFPGYQSSGQFGCIDINECATNNGGCNHYCTNSVGGFNCSCVAGFELQDKFTCIDINECLRQTHDCTANDGTQNYSCINDVGSFHCDCPAGYILLGYQGHICEPSLCPRITLNHCAATTIYGYDCQYPVMKCASSTNFTQSCPLACLGGRSFVLDGPDLDMQNSQNSSTYTIDLNCQSTGTWTSYSYASCRRSNYPPTGILISNNSIPENEVGIFVGSLSVTDRDLADTYSFTLLTGTSNFYLANNDELYVRRSQDYESLSSLSILVFVRDSGDNSFQQSITIFVTDVNESPTGVVLSSKYLSENSQLGTSFTNLLATDPDTGDSHTFLLVGANDYFTLAGASLVLSYKVPNYEVQNLYTFTVQVTDRAGLSANFSITVNFLDANDPVTLVQLSSTSINEELPANSFIGAFSVFDEDTLTNQSWLVGRAPQTFSFSVTSGGAWFLASGASLLSKVVFDYEVNTSFPITVLVRDSGSPSSNDSKAFTISIQNIDELPSLIVFQNSSVFENTGAGQFAGNVSVYDEDANEGLDIQIYGGIGAQYLKVVDQACSSIYLTGSSLSPPLKNNHPYSLCTADLITVQVIDYEFSAEIPFSLIALDVSLNSTLNLSVVVDVIDLNDPASSTMLSNYFVYENTPAGILLAEVFSSDQDQVSNLTYSLSIGSPPFSIFGNELVVDEDSSKLDYETQPTILIQVRASDNGVPPFVTYTEFNITVGDINEAPFRISFTQNSSLSASLVIPENSPASAVVSLFQVFDPDNEVSIRQHFNCVIQGSVAAIFGVNNTPIVDALQHVEYLQLMLLQNVLDYEKLAHYLEVPISCNDTGVPPLSYGMRFNVSVLNVNEQPTEISLSGSSVLESAEIGTVVGYLYAQDPDNANGEDPNRGLTFSVDSTFSNGPPFSPFGVKTDPWRLETTKKLNFESASLYTVQLRVIDSGGLNLIRNFSLNVADVNDPPTNISLSGLSLVEEMLGSCAGSLSTADEDLVQSHSYSIIADPSTEGSMFVILNGTYLCLKPSISADYEVYSSLTVLIRSTDNGQPFARSVQRLFNLSIENVNEAPSKIMLATIANALLPSTIFFPENPPLFGQNWSTPLNRFIVVDPDNGGLQDDAAANLSDCGLTRLYTSPSVLSMAIALDPVRDYLSLTPTHELFLTGIKRFDFEEMDRFLLVVTCNDHGNPPLSVTSNFTLQIQNINEPPEAVYLQSFKFSKNLSNLSVSSGIGVPENLVKDSLLSVIGIIDPDNACTKSSNCPPHQSVSVTYAALYDVTSLLTNDKMYINFGTWTSLSQFQLQELQFATSDMMNIEPNDNNLKPANMFGYPLAFWDYGFIFSAGSNSFDYEQFRTFLIFVNVSDTDGASETFYLFLNVQDRNDPQTDLGIGPGRLTVISIPENSALPYNLGSINVSDQDSILNVTGQHTFWISFVAIPLYTFHVNILGPTNGTLVIDFTVPKKPKESSIGLDYELQTSYRVALYSKDLSESPITTSASILVLVEDVNEKPNLIQFVTPVTAISEALSPLSVITYFNVIDPDNFNGTEPLIPPRQQHLCFVSILTCRSAVSDSILQPCPFASPFAIVADGHAGLSYGRNFTFAIAPTPALLNYEVVSHYGLALNCSDSGTPSLALSVLVNISITDANDAPTNLQFVLPTPSGSSSLLQPLSSFAFSMDELTETSLENAEFFGTVTYLGTLHVDDEDVGQTHTFAFDPTLLNFANAVAYDEGIAFPFEIQNGSLYLVHPENIDFELVSSWVLPILAFDNGTPVQNLLRNFSIFIKNVNERPSDLLFSCGCKGSPCQNGAECADLPLTSLVAAVASNKSPYICTCPLGFSGGDCEVPFSPLGVGGNSSSCLSIHPSLQPGYVLGYFRTVDPDEGDQFSYTLLPGSDSHVALDGSSLVLMSSVASSASLSIFMRTTDSGLKSREVSFTFLSNPCAGSRNNCNENAYCSPTDSENFKCTCNVGYDGDGFRCSKLVCRYADPGQVCTPDTDTCRSKPCQNGGTCTDTIENGLPSFLCACPVAFVGQKCQFDKDECSPSPCKNGGICHQSFGLPYFQCSCPPLYQGLYCQFSEDQCLSNPDQCNEFVGNEVCLPPSSTLPGSLQCVSPSKLVPLAFKSPLNVCFPVSGVSPSLCSGVWNSTVAMFLSFLSGILGADSEVYVHSFQLAQALGINETFATVIILSVLTKTNRDGLAASAVATTLVSRCQQQLVFGASFFDPVFAPFCQFEFVERLLPSTTTVPTTTVVETEAPANASTISSSSSSGSKNSLVIAVCVLIGLALIIAVIVRVARRKVRSWSQIRTLPREQDRSTVAFQNPSYESIFNENPSFQSFGHDGDGNESVFAKPAPRINTMTSEEPLDGGSSPQELAPNRLTPLPAEQQGSTKRPLSMIDVRPMGTLERRDTPVAVPAPNLTTLRRNKSSSLLSNPEMATLRRPIPTSSSTSTLRRQQSGTLERQTSGSLERPKTATLKRQVSGGTLERRTSTASLLSDKDRSLNTLRRGSSTKRGVDYIVSGEDEEDEDESGYLMISPDPVASGVRVERSVSITNPLFEPQLDEEGNFTPRFNPNAIFDEEEQPTLIAAAPPRNPPFGLPNEVHDEEDAESSQQEALARLVRDRLRDPRTDPALEDDED